IRSAVEKLRKVRALAGSRPIDIEIDGGITPENAAEVARAGANALVAGSAVFKDRTPESYRANIAAIRQAAALVRGEAACWECWSRANGATKIRRARSAKPAISSAWTARSATASLPTARRAFRPRPAAI